MAAPASDRRRGSLAPLLPIVRELARRMGVGLTEPAAASLAAFAELVRAWNQRVNLTAARDDLSLCEVMLGDALVLQARQLVQDGARLCDVGTGAGAPMLPLLLLRPDLRALCIEPLQKRAAFLRTAGVRLSVSERAQVRQDKLDADAPALPEAPFDVACSRATFAPARWLEVGIRLAPAVLVLTTSEAELPHSVHAVRAAVTCYALPFSGAPRCVARYERRG